MCLHASEDGGRANLEQIFKQLRPEDHVYTCGPDTYMQAVLSCAEAAGLPEENRHFEYFSAPDTHAYVNHPFTLELADGRVVHVSKEQTGTQALAAAGIPVDVKCSDGICGVCKCIVREGDVEHRDFVLSKSQRKNTMILCQSRAADPNGTIKIEF